MKNAGERGRLARGARLIGKYEIVRPIGSGGFGMVYEAMHLGLGVKVALKVLHGERRQHAETLERFRREAWASAQLTSQHCVRVMDVDVLEDGSPFIVMELLRGRDLEAELARRGRMPVSEAVSYVLQAASAIAEAHARGIVHRDLKPNNLFVVDPAGLPQLKVLDFGLSKLASDLSLTGTTAQLGTPRYMSPEQFRAAKDVDPRSDIWALGVILFELLALRPPFVGRTRTDTMLAILSEPAPDLRVLAPNVPPRLAAIVMRALCKEPARRFQSVTDLAAALAPFSPAGAFIAPHAPAHPTPRQRSTTLTDSSHDTPAFPPPSPLWAPLSLGALLGIVALGFGWRAWHVAATHTLPPTVAAAALVGSPATQAPVVIATQPAAPRAAVAPSTLPSVRPRTLFKPARLTAPADSAVHAAPSAATPKPLSTTDVGF